jgi:hypothetical protein
MQTHTFLKGTLAGGVGAAAVLAATAAFAGTGIGGVFNLGQVNTVNATSTLTGAKPDGAQLQVTNTSTTGAAAGLSVTTAAGKPPLTVSNNVLVPRLNAQFLGGYAANGLGRVGLAATENLAAFSSPTTQATVSITAPAKGFVRLDGRIIAYDAFSSSFCTDCSVQVRIHDDTSGGDSIMAYAEGGATTHATSMMIPVTWVFPVTARGTYTYSLTTAQVILSGGGFGLFNPVLTAQYVPFGATGSQSSLARTARSAGKVRTVPAGK